MYIYTYIYALCIYIYIYITCIIYYPILGVEINQGYKAILAPSVDKETRNYDTIIPPNHHKALGLSHTKIKLGAIYI